MGANLRVDLPGALPCAPSGGRAIDVSDDNAALEVLANKARPPVEVLRKFEAGEGPADHATLARIFHAYDALTERIVGPVFHVTAALRMFDLEGLGRG